MTGIVKTLTPAEIQRGAEVFGYCGGWLPTPGSAWVFIP